MNFFRTHILRSVSAFMLLAGMVLYLIYPASDSNRHEAFTNWLQNHVKSQDNAHVLHQIHQLSSKDGELESVIREASRLVQNHSDDFELPLSSETSNENEVFHLLLTEWNQFRHNSNGMGKAVIVENVKTHSVLPTDGFSALYKMVENHRISSLQSWNTPSLAWAELPDYHISPLSGGIAIGAP